MHQIIRDSVNDQIAFNIIDLKDPKEMSNKLKSIYIKVGQGVVYSILQELLHYPKIIKSKGYKKLIMQILTKVEYLCKCLQTAMTLEQNFWDIIAIVIALNSLHKDFNMTIAKLLKTSNKTINKIWSIFQSKKAKNLNERAIGFL